MQSNDATIFIIDDDEEILSYLSVILKNSYGKVKSFLSAETFLDYYQPDMFGCLVLDINLAGISGMKLQSILVDRGHQIPIIFVSGTRDISVSIKAFKSGAFDFIEKGNVNAGLIPVVEKAIKHDLNSRKMLQRKLEGAVRFYAESIVETVRQPLFVLDQNLKVVLANQFSYSMFNVAQNSESPKNHQYFETILATIPGLKDNLSKLINFNQELIDHEVTFELFCCGEMTLIINARILGEGYLGEGYLAGGKYMSRNNNILLAFENITKRKKIEQDLYREKEQALVTLQSIGEAVISMDCYGYIEYLNPIAETLTEWSQATAKGMAIDEVLKLACDQSNEKFLCPLSLCLEQNDTPFLNENLVLKSRSNAYYSIELSTAVIRNEDNAIDGLVIAFKDVSKQRKLAKELVFQASHDVLTGLVNRREFEKRVNRVIKNTRDGEIQSVLCFLDLDQFKIVNDSAGHRAGDELLKQISQLILENIRSRDSLARIGGDEFGLILENCPLERARTIVDTLISKIKNYRFIWEGSIFSIGLSVGMVVVSDCVDSAEQLLSNADFACYTAKNQGRNQSQLYDENSKSATKYNESLQAAGLAHALENEQFRLYCQPIFSINKGKREIVNYEVLLRLVDESGNILLPGSFIPAAERFGLMIDVDRWVIKNALLQYSQRKNTMDNISIAINLSGNSLNDKGLFEFVDTQLIENCIPPGNVCFEITETAAIHNIDIATTFINALKLKGCRFALDDFGSGLSSFSYLQKLPIDYLKIDGSFVKDIVGNSVDHAMVVAINKIGHSMGIDIIAEYAETEEVIAELQNIGVDFAQGYGLQKPIPLDSVL